MPIVIFKNKKNNVYDKIKNNKLFNPTLDTLNPIIFSSKNKNEIN